MLQNNNYYKVLKIFLDSPTYRFGLREISRKIKLSFPSVKRYLLELEKENLIRVIKEKGNPIYLAEIDSEKFKFYKIISIQYELFDSRVIDYLWKKISPEAIILYGSYRKGESIEDSDIDIFIIGKKDRVELDKYEKIIGKKIHVIIEENHKISNELKNNLINGIVLKGYFKVLK